MDPADPIKRPCVVWRPPCGPCAILTGTCAVSRGGRGLDGRLDHALLQSGNRDMNSDGLAMGFARLSSGAPRLLWMPKSLHKARGGECACLNLAFEMTSGRRAVIVNCGSGIHSAKIGAAQGAQHPPIPHYTSKGNQALVWGANYHTAGLSERFW